MVGKKKQIEDLQIKKLIAAPCEAIKTVAEEHLSSENIYIYIPTFWLVDDHDEVAMYLLTYHHEAN